MAPKGKGKAAWKRSSLKEGGRGNDQTDLVSAFAKQAQSPKELRPKEQTGVLECMDTIASSDDEQPVKPSKRARFEAEEIKAEERAVAIATDPEGDDDSADVYAERELKLPRLAGLAVHPKKAEHVRLWLEQATSQAQGRLLVLAGPSGAGKSTCLRLLADQLELSVVEWRNPMTDSRTDMDSLAVKFDRFLATANRYDALNLTAGAAPDLRKSIVLIEDLPNIFSTNSFTNDLRTAFRRSLLRYLYDPRRASPLVIIVTEMEARMHEDDSHAPDIVSAKRLLGTEVMEAPRTTSIFFNAVAATYLKRALLGATEHDLRYRSRYVSNAILHELVTNAGGDLRCALNSLDVIYPSLPLAKSRKTRPKLKRNEIPVATAAENHALKLVSTRESALNYRHAIGKLLYNKHMLNPHAGEQWTHRLEPDTPRRVPENDASVIIEEAAVSSQVFLAGVHRNYLGSTNHVALSSAVLEVLCDADVASHRQYKAGDMVKAQAAVIGVLSLQALLPADAARVEPQLYFPADFQIRKATDEMKLLMDSYQPSSLLGLHTRNVVGLQESVSYALRISNAKPTSDPSSNSREYRRLIDFSLDGRAENREMDDSEVGTQAVAKLVSAEHNPSRLDESLIVDDDIEELD